MSLVLKQKGLLEKEFAKDGISIVWVQSPEVLLLDEPFSALDAFTRHDLQDHLLNLWADTPTLVLITHDVDEAVVLADGVLVMRPRPGRLFEQIKVNLTRPRYRSLDRPADGDATSRIGESMWW